ncbi:MAG: rhodanese-like domain-containing protein [Candidatus Methylumidiphilus sp.]
MSVEDIVRLANEARTRIREVSPDESRELAANGAILIDVREEKEFKAGSIAGAILISRGQLATRIADAVPDLSTPIVCFCAVGHRSAIAADTLQKLGYQHVVSLKDGLKAYLVSHGNRKVA